jgi:hypothetical protein
MEDREGQEKKREGREITRKWMVRKQGNGWKETRK